MSLDETQMYLSGLGRKHRIPTQLIAQRAPFPQWSMGLVASCCTSAFHQQKLGNWSGSRARWIAPKTLGKNDGITRVELICLSWRKAPALCHVTKCFNILLKNDDFIITKSIFYQRSEQSARNRVIHLCSDVRWWRPAPLLPYLTRDPVSSIIRDIFPQAIIFTCIISTAPDKGAASSPSPIHACDSSLNIIPRSRARHHHPSSSFIHHPQATGASL